MSDKEKNLVKELSEEKEVLPAAEAEVKVETEAEEGSPESNEASLTTTEPSTTETGPARDERLWAALAHASVLLTFAVGISTGGLAVIIMALIPLFIWLLFRDRSRFIAFHAMQATIFQLGSLVAWIGLLLAGLLILIPTWIVTALLLVVVIGFLLLPLALVLTLALPAGLIALPFASLVYGLYGAYEVYAGREFRYWMVADWIEERGIVKA